MKKILILGTSARFSNRNDNEITSVPWKKVNFSINVSDYDAVIINLLSSSNRNEVQANILPSLLNPEILVNLFVGGGFAVILGDPRFGISPWGWNYDERRDSKFLGWTAHIFDWDDRRGDSITLTKNGIESEKLKNYLCHLRKYNYSLRGELTNFFKGKLTSARISFARTKYNYDLVFSLLLIPQENKLEGNHVGGFPTSRKLYGPLLFLPEIDLTHDETIALVLKDICGVETNLVPPLWISEITVPGQEAIETEVTKLAETIRTSSIKLNSLKSELSEVRQILRILYDAGSSLEEVVREVLKRLGAEVRVPVETNKEDGWIEVKVGDTNLEGVLEIKSTRNESFSEEGLRQLLEWRQRGIEKEHKKYKGIFIGNHALEKHYHDRKSPYSPSFTENCNLNEFVAITTLQLWELYLLDCKGDLNRDEFWNELFSTNGTLDVSNITSTQSSTEI